MINNQHASGDEHPLVEALAGRAPGEGVVAYHGYKGRANDDGRVRIYTRDDLSSYVDVARADVLHEEHHGREPSQFWLRESAPVNFSRTTRPMPLLTGAIADSFHAGGVQFDLELTAAQAWHTHDGTCDAHSFDACYSQTRSGCSFETWCC